MMVPRLVYLAFSYVPKGIICIQGSKCELVKKEGTLVSLVDALETKLFRDKSQFLVHCLRKLLGGQLRKEIHNNLAVTDLVSYIDFSKGTWWFLCNILFSSTKGLNINTKVGFHHLPTHIPTFRALLNYLERFKFGI